MGDRIAALQTAVKALEVTMGVRVRRVSHAYETEPVGPEDQNAYVNLAVEVGTDLGPLELLQEVKAIEWRGGRRPGLRWGPRPIDIDVVSFGWVVLQTEHLTLPHRAFRGRSFVLMPLAEIAPEAVDPVTRSTFSELAARPGLQGRVIRQLA